MEGPQAIAALALGYALQWAKGFKRLPTWAVQAVCAVLCAGCYVLFVSAPTAGNWREWLGEVVKWALASIGTASVVGHANLAPKTDSL